MLWEHEVALRAVPRPPPAAPPPPRPPEAELTWNTSRPESCPTTRRTSPASTSSSARAQFASNRKLILRAGGEGAPREAGRSASARGGERQGGAG